MSDIRTIPLNKICIEKPEREINIIIIPSSTYNNKLIKNT